MRAATIASFVLAMVMGGTVGSGAEDEREDERPPHLVRQLGSDFVHVFTTRENLLTLGIGAGAAWGASAWDDEIATSRLNSERNGGTSLDNTFEAGEILGGAAVQVGGAFAAYGLGKVFKNSDVEELGRELVRAQLVTQTLTFGLKAAVGRERPDGSNHQSFPSGHASGTFATATILEQRYGWSIGIPAYAIAGYVAASRLNEGRHYLSDVVFGAAVGIIVGRTVSIAIARKRFAVGPMVTPGGAGVQLSWMPSSSTVH